MKVIPKSDLIKMIKTINTAKSDVIFENEMKAFFETYGDDYFREMSSWSDYELCKTNDLRKELIGEYK